MPVVYQWRQANNPEEIARQAADHLLAGRPVILPTEAGPMIALRSGGRPPTGSTVSPPRSTSTRSTSAVAPRRTSALKVCGGCGGLSQAGWCPGPAPR